MTQEEFNILIFELMKQIVSNQTDIIQLLKSNSVKCKNNGILGCASSNR